VVKPPPWWLQGGAERIIGILAALLWISMLHRRLEAHPGERKNVSGLIIIHSDNGALERPC